MRTIGLLGGMSWESTEIYYRIINETVRERLGGLRSAKILLSSVDFAPIEELQREGAWGRIAELLCEESRRLERGGAEGIVLCSNTAHRAAPEIRAAVGIPLLHVAEVTASALCDQCIDTAALLGTRYTMLDEFYRKKLDEAGIRTLIPPADEAERIDRVIFDELCRGVLREESALLLRRSVDRLAARGAQGVILGCTELGLLIGQEDLPLPLFDTTLLHARRAALWSLEDGAL